MNFIGSEQVEISVANQEILPNPPEGWTVSYKLKQFSIRNIEECTISINNSNPIKLQAGQGFNAIEVATVKILEDGISYNWAGAY